MFRKAIALSLVALLPAALAADGGTPRVVERRGGKSIAIFTSPTPPCVGDIDVGVLVQNERTGGPLLDAEIAVAGYPLGEPDRRRSGIAASSSNKLMHAERLNVDEPGRWRIDVTVDGERFEFEMSIADPPPAWRELLPWFAWPIVAIGLFAAHRWLSRRYSSRSA